MDMDMDSFIEKHKLTMTARRATENPHMSASAGDGESSFYRNAFHFHITIENSKGGKFETFFSMGKGHAHPAFPTIPRKKPELPEVLESLAMEAESVESSSGFVDWWRNLGYEPKTDIELSRLRLTYDTIKAQAAKLERFLGGEAYDVLLWEIDR